MTEPQRYWFSAKRYGWGWGPPLTWQGWLIFIGWIAAVFFAATRLLPFHTVAFAIFTAVMVVLLMLICYLKGEPTRWRWGD
ncbi:MAG TPA: hypothetical protein VGV09_07440 [Steroidobacteraceae bacterium]|nr:hypothetical protein [Steroidobacteraceae bacterium]